MSLKARRVVGPTSVRPFEWDVEFATFPVDRAVSPMAAADRETCIKAIEREAFGQGIAEGEKAGLEIARQRVDDMQARLTRTLEELARVRAAVIRRTERQMVDLSLSIARRIVRREVKLDPDFVIAMARVALERVDDGDVATIKLNPEDYEAAIATQAVDWAGSHVRIVPDTAVERGGCQVESEFGSLDASVDAQFEELANAIRNGQGLEEI